jgi:Protein of unknown function (DUF3455)
MKHIYVSALATATAAAIAGCATNTATAPAASSKLSPPANAKLVSKVGAIGVQIYKCGVKDGKFAWAFVAPEADLFDMAGKLVGKHGAGPFWEMPDGSKVNGTVAQREDSTSCSTRNQPAEQDQSRA